MTSNLPESVSLEILVSGITEENKESVCTSISDALSGKSTRCSLTINKRRRLLTYHTLYLDVRVKSAQSAIALVESDSFLDDLDLPDGVHVFSVTVVSGFLPTDNAVLPKSADKPKEKVKWIIPTIMIVSFIVAVLLYSYVSNALYKRNDDKKLTLEMTDRVAKNGLFKGTEI